MYLLVLWNTLFHEKSIKLNGYKASLRAKLQWLGRSIEPFV
jgi:hypothetical protein